jgi:hypothetical protein
VDYELLQLISYVVAIALVVLGLCRAGELYKK